MVVGKGKRRCDLYLLTGETNSHLLLFVDETQDRKLQASYPKSRWETVRGIPKYGKLQNIQSVMKIGTRVKATEIGIGVVPAQPRLREVTLETCGCSDGTIVQAPPFKGTFVALRGDEQFYLNPFGTTTLKGTGFAFAECLPSLKRPLGG